MAFLVATLLWCLANSSEHFVEQVLICGLAHRAAAIGLQQITGTAWALSLRGRSGPSRVHASLRMAFLDAGKVSVSERVTVRVLLGTVASVKSVPARENPCNMPG